MKSITRWLIICLMPINAGDSLLNLPENVHSNTLVTVLSMRRKLWFIMAVSFRKIFFHILVTMHDKELDQNRTRSDERLEKLASRMDPTDDISSLQNNTLSPNAIMHNTSIKVRTNNGQSVLATGAIQADETIDGKTYSVFETELPAAMKWQIAVGNYNDYIASVGNNVATQYKIR